MGGVLIVSEMMSVMLSVAEFECSAVVRDVPSADPKAVDCKWSSVAMGTDFVACDVNSVCTTEVGGCAAVCTFTTFGHIDDDVRASVNAYCVVSSGTCCVDAPLPY